LRDTHDDVVVVPLTLKRNDVQNLLRILEFVEPMKIETTK